MSVTCAKCDRTWTGSAEALPDGWINQVSTMSERTFTVCGECATPAARESRGTGDHAADQLRLFIERIERIEGEIAEAQADRRDVYAEAKANGYDNKVMREIVKRRRMDGHALAEFEGILETYQAALGMS